VVLGVERSQLGVAGHAGVELVGESAERLVATHLFVEALIGHGTSLSARASAAPPHALRTAAPVSALGGTRAIAVRGHDVGSADPCAVQRSLDPRADLPGDREVLVGCALGGDPDG